MVLPPRQNDLKNEETKLTAANGTVIKMYGERLIKLDFGTGRTIEWVFHIADVKKPIISIEFLRNFEFSIHPAHGKIKDEITEVEVAAYRDNIVTL